jgi:hypothetical protein
MNLIRNNLVIELHVPDFTPIKDFYSKLGFQITLEDAITENYPGYLTLLRKDSLGNTMLNFYGGDNRVFEQSHFKKFPPGTSKGYAVEITIPVSNVEKVYEEIKQSIPDHIVRELTEMKDDHVTWKDFRLTDPFGFYIRITELVNWGQ